MGWGKRRETVPMPPATKQVVEAQVVEPQVVERTAPEPSMQPHIGKSLQIQGEVTGNEDITIDGRIDGKINLGDHTLTIGPTGRIQADIQARSVVIAGQVVGKVTAADKVEIASTGSLKGDIRSARVVLMEGSQFKGNVDTGWEGGDDAGTASAFEAEETAEETAQATEPAVTAAGPASKSLSGMTWGKS